ncbi:Abi family protein [Flavivirga amylovorans]|uniref:Abi family protein n=1 Tax=Flavivirga amylovorans TaxID=870486 RepID=A0ABT8X3E2_9FLAO|nr:Abi family protein [Flavivirga amylovorans]MDO5988416.1 Abi family protein [Flavivirga amylovorans]
MKIYVKPPLSYQEQLDKLIERGLTVEHPDKALHLLENLSYYRLSGYLYPMLSEPKEAHKFKENSTLENAFKIYCFDRELKQLLSSEIEKIEVSFRAKITYVLSHKYDAFWYTYERLFKSNDTHRRSLDSTYAMVNESTEDFAIKFKQNYVNTYLPSWMALEIVTFTHLSKLYSNLIDSSAKTEIAAFYGVNTPILENWLMIITYTRNICAHHSRFWNRRLSYKLSKFKKQPIYDWVDMTDIPKNSSYAYICIVKYLSDRVNPKNTFKEKILGLLDKYPNIDNYKGMSFPQDWREQPLWKNNLNNTALVKEKEQKPKEEPLKINTSLDDVLKASIPKPKEKE